MFSLLDPPLQSLSCLLIGAFRLLVLAIVAVIVVVSFVLLVSLTHFSCSLFTCLPSFLGLTDHLTLLIFFLFVYQLYLVILVILRVCSVHAQLIEFYFQIVPYG